MHDIVAIGGNSFPKGTLTPIHRYVLGLARATPPRVCFIPTATGDAQWAIDNFYSAFGKAGELSHLTLFDNTTLDIEALLVLQDVIVVGGGNTRNMLLLWHAWGVDRAIRAAWDNGTVLAGQSAGGLCWFQSGITDSYPKHFREILPGLGAGKLLSALRLGSRSPAGPRGAHRRRHAARRLRRRRRRRHPPARRKTRQRGFGKTGKNAYAVRAENGVMIRELLEAEALT